MEENTENNGQITGKDPKTGQFVKGNKLGGKTPGSLDFTTKWYRFIEKVASQNGITVDEVDEQMLKVAWKQIQSGDFRYYKDTLDRIHGTATNKQDVNLNAHVEFVIAEKLANKLGLNDTTSNTEPSN